jgi:hypothetical protein
MWVPKACICRWTCRSTRFRSGLTTQIAQVNTSVNTQNNRAAPGVGQFSAIVRAPFFNAPNTSLTVTTNAQGPTVFNSATFGLIASSRAARFLQLVARFEF